MDVTLMISKAENPHKALEKQIIPYMSQTLSRLWFTRDEKIHPVSLWTNTLVYFVQLETKNNNDQRERTTKKHPCFPITHRTIDRDRQRKEKERDVVARDSTTT